MTAINASRDTLNKSNLPAFLYKCDTMNLLKLLCNSQQCPTHVGRPFDTDDFITEVPASFDCHGLRHHSDVNVMV